MTPMRISFCCTHSMEVFGQCCLSTVITHDGICHDFDHIA